MSSLTTPPPEDPPQTAPVQSAHTKSYRRPLLLFSLIGLLLIGGAWYDMRREITGVRGDLARRLSAADTQGKESRLLAEQSREMTKEAEIKLGVLEAKLQESQNQQISLEALYQELSRSRDESLLADVEQTLTIANQQLQVAGNVKSALIALYAADARLARLDRPQLAGLRKVIARDIDRLKVAPYVDTIGLSARLDNLIATVDSLPLVMETRPAPATQARGQNAAPASVWQRLTSELWQEVRELVRLQNMDRPDAPLLAPTQTYFLRENLKLRLLGARLAVLARDEQSYKADLGAARESLQRYFDVRSKAVTTALDSMRELNASEVSVALPDVAASLDAVRNYRLARERTR